MNGHTLMSRETSLYLCRSPSWRNTCTWKQSMPLHPSCLELLGLDSTDGSRAAPYRPQTSRVPILQTTLQILFQTRFTIFSRPSSFSTTTGNSALPVLPTPLLYMSYYSFIYEPSSQTPTRATVVSPPFRGLPGFVEQQRYMSRIKHLRLRSAGTRLAMCLSRPGSISIVSWPFVYSTTLWVWKIFSTCPQTRALRCSSCRTMRFTPSCSIPCLATLVYALQLVTCIVRDIIL